MKTIILTLAIFTGASLSYGNSEGTEKKLIQESMQSWVTQNVNYPESAKKEKIEGTVFVEFVVEQGAVKGAKVVSGSEAELNEAALDIINSIPDSIMKATREMNQSKFVLPIKFDLK